MKNLLVNRVCDISNVLYILIFVLEAIVSIVPTPSFWKQHDSKCSVLNLPLSIYVLLLVTNFANLVYTDLGIE